MDWFINLGYVGLFLASLLAGTVISLGLDFIYIAVMLAGGNPIICLLVATVGNAIGAMLTYLLGWLGKWEWLEKYCGIKRETLEKQKPLICKYGMWTAFFSYLPIIGLVGVIALGFYKVKPAKTALIVLLGCFCRFLLWTVLFYWKGEVFIEWFHATFKKKA